MVSNWSIHSQKVSSSQNLKIPDSIYNKLEEFYIKERGTVNSHINVYNLIDKKSFGFKSGIYSFSLTGPHFPRRIFIFYNNKTYIFKSVGAFDSIGILQEFIECIKILSISESDRIKYLKAISNYLQEELGQTYGAEITKD
ncbi:hypothetical protein D3C85_662880 [compost metagenome]